MSDRAEDGVLWVVEVKRKDGGWEPAWDGEGAHVERHIPERLQNDPGISMEETRVVKYVRAEG